MCGIVGYIGTKKASPILINGLIRLEYRGYDSAGISTVEKNELSIMFDGESVNPQAVADEIKKAVAALRADGIDDEQFENARRSLYGREIMEYNDIDSIANAVLSAYFNGYSVFDTMEIYKSVTKEDIEKRLENMMMEEYSALSVVKNKENE